MPPAPGLGRPRKEKWCCSPCSLETLKLRQADGGAAEVEGPDGPDQAREGEREIGRSFGAKQLQGNEGRGGAEADDIRQAVELSAEVGGVPGEARQPSIQRVEAHCGKDEVGADDEAAMRQPGGQRIAKERRPGLRCGG